MGGETTRARFRTPRPTVSSVPTVAAVSVDVAFNAPPCRHVHGLTVQASISLSVYYLLRLYGPLLASPPSSLLPSIAQLVSILTMPNSVISSTSLAVLCSVLFCCSLPPTASAFSLQVYNDSTCTVSLQGYSYSNNKLDYTAPTTVCVDGGTTAAGVQSVAYMCANSTSLHFVNLNLLAYTQSNCAGNDSWQVYIPGNVTTGVSGGPQGVCTTMTLHQPSGSESTVYGVVSCPTSNGGAKGARVAMGLLAALLFVGSLLV